MNDFLEILPKVLIAAGAGFLGGMVALFWSPKVWARSAIQHFAAGAVLAAVASGVIPEAERTGSVFGILAGFAAGGLTMIGLKWLVLKFERRDKSQGKQPIGLAAAAAIDTLVDGALIAAGFSSGQQLGTLLVAALALELFFLNLSVGSEFSKGKSKRWQGLLVTTWNFGFDVGWSFHRQLDIERSLRCHHRGWSGIWVSGVDLFDRRGVTGRSDPG